jgi:anti-sigma B factor antagonist
MGFDGDGSSRGCRPAVPGLRRLPDGRSVVRVGGGLRGEAAEQVHRLGVGEVRRRTAQLVVDLSAVTDIDRAGVVALTALAESAGKADVGFCLVGAHTGPVATALEDSGYTELFEIFASLDDA